MAQRIELPPGYTTVAEVVRDELCHSCGVCGGICPKGAIGFDDRAYPAIEPDSCNGCGLCLQVCSGWRGTFFRPDVPDATPTSLAHTLDEQLRQTSSSGGLVTELLRFMLSTGAINKALVTIADPDNPLRPMSVLAETEAELLRSSQSRYCLFPWGKVVARLLRNSEPYAVVGTSCQLSSFNYAMAVFPRLREHLVLQIGICCESNVEPAATDHLIRIRKISSGDVQRLAYRHGQWPGVMAAFLRDGRMTVLSNRNKLEGAINYLKLAYGRGRCHLCCDVLCRLADLTVGDPWCRNDSGELTWRGSWGYSAVMVHQEVAGKWLTALQRDGRIWLEDQPAASLLKTQLDQESRCRKRVARTGLAPSGKAISLVNSGGADKTQQKPTGVKRMALLLRAAVRHEPVRSIFMRLMLSPLGDVLTAMNVGRKRRRHQRR